MNRCPPVLDVATIPFPVVFWSVLPSLPPSYAPSGLSEQTAFFDLCPGSHGSPSISWADSELLYLQPQIPGAFRAIWCVLGACFCLPVPLRSVALCLIPPSVDSSLRCLSLQTSLANYFEIRSSQTTKSRDWRRSHRKAKPGRGTRVLQS